MAGRSGLTKGLAWAGTILAWLPIAAPLLLSLAQLSRGGPFRLDYLMPAELFPVALIGGGLLVWAAVRARSHRRTIGWSLAALVLLMVGSQALAVVTGLASGETEPVGWPLWIVMGALVGYVAALAVLAVSGVLLLRALHSRGADGGSS